MPSPLPRVRRICLALPEAHEVEAWGEPTFRIKGGRIFAMYAHASNHHGGGRYSVWIKAAAENQALMIRAQPERFFKPPYVGPSGWVGVYLDKSPDWDEVAELLRDGWRMIAPKKLAAISEQPASVSKKRSATSGKRTTRSKRAANAPSARRRKR